MSFTIQDIRSWRPCYNPSRYLPEDWSGTALDILKHTKIPAQDKLWVVLRQDVLDDKTLRLFAVACARQALSLVPKPDQRSIAACDVAERYVNGQATKEELQAAAAAARAAAKAAYAAAARAAAKAADAAYAAAARAADAAYAAAARAAADAAAAAAAKAADAAADAADAAYAAAADVAYEWQVTKLIEMLEGLSND